MLYGAQPYSEEWKVEFQRIWNNATEGSEAHRNMIEIWSQIEADYGPQHPNVVHQKLRDEPAQLVVWYTSKYSEAAGAWMKSNPRFDTMIDGNVTNMTGWRSGGHGWSSDCDMKCIITDDARLAKTADVLMFEVNILYFKSINSSRRSMPKGSLHKSNGIII